MSDLIIKISAESKEFDKAIENIGKETEGLEDKLKSVATISGALFAGLVASAGVAVAAFANSEKSTLELTNALKNQGIASNALLQGYQDLAAELQKKTGVDDDAIVKGQAILQGFIGQKTVTKELALAMVNLSEKTGSVGSAAEILGLAINGNVRGLRQFGIVIDESLNREERYAKILEVVNLKFGGLAEASNQGLGGVRGLKNAFSDFLENIGAKLAPTISEIVVSLTKFFQTLNDNKPLTDFIFEVGKIAVIVTGVVTGLATGGIALLQLQKAFQIAEAAMTAFGLASKVAVGATGFGLLLIVAAEVYANWNKIFPVMQAVYNSFVSNISNLSRALGDILKGVVTFDIAKISSGISQAKSVIAAGFQAIKEVAPEGEISLAKAITSTPEQIAAAKAASEEVAFNEKAKTAQIIAENEVLKLTLEQNSASLIELKRAEVETLKQLQEERFTKERTALEEHLSLLAAREDQERANAQARQLAFNNQVLANSAQFQSLSIEQQKLFLDAKGAKLRDSLLTEQTAREANINQDLTTRINANNRFLQEQEKYGTAYATINRVLYSEQVQGAGAAFTQLSALQRSNNATLKTIGKAAAIADITIKTAQSAMAIFQGFAAIPIIGVPLGIAGAAAAVAFGAEQIGNVVAAQSGGIVPGFNNGGDSVPSILQPGELVVPRNSFSEVVNAVANARARESAIIGSSSGGAGLSEVSVTLNFSGDNAEKFLTAKQVEARSLGTLRESSG